MPDLSNEELQRLAFAAGEGDPAALTLVIDAVRTTSTGWRYGCCGTPLTPKTPPRKRSSGS